MVYHVLLADDDESITKGLADILRAHFPGQFCLHLANSGTQLKTLLCTVPAALVISDIKMPGMSGLECLQFVREQGLRCEVVLLSGYDDYSLIRNALRLSVADYMLKPVHIDSLVRLIREILPRLEGRAFAPAGDVCAPVKTVNAAPYFDINVENPLDEAGLNERLEWFELGMQHMDAPAAQEALRAFFNGNDGGVWDETATKNALIRRIYHLMELVPAMIHIIAENKLTRYDAVSSIKSLPTTSQLRDRLIETIGYDVEQLKKITEKRDQHLVAQAKAYIAQHYMTGLTLEELAGELHINPGYFSTLFKQLSGVTFREYLRALRIEKAQELIRRDDGKLYEIAERVGYQNASHFNRAFKEVTGVTPSIWALHHRRKTGR